MQLWLPMTVMAGYLSSAVLFVKVQKKRLNPLWALGAQVLACQGHALLLIQTIVAPDGRLNLSVFNMTSVNAWLVAILSLFWLWRPSLALGGVIISSINALVVVLPLIFVSYKPFPMQLSAGIWWHITTSITAWTLISLAFLHALLYSWVFHNLKKKQLKNGSQISLVALERMMVLYATIGFVLLTASLITGAMFVKNLLAQHLVHKTIFSLLAWFALVWALFSYYLRHQRGMKLVYEMFIVFVLLVMGYVLTNIILQFII